MFAKAFLLFRDLRFDLRFAHHCFLQRSVASVTAGITLLLLADEAAANVSTQHHQLCVSTCRNRTCLDYVREFV